MFVGQFSLIGSVEESMRRLLDLIEEDDARKGLRTRIVIDYDELSQEIPNARERD